MSRISPTVEGFRASFRRPSFTLAEIAWRWMVGATACTLFAFGLVEYLSTLPVTNGDLLFLRTRHPILVGQAIAHILRGSLGRGVVAGLLAALALAGLWVFAASLGRVATLRALLDYFRNDVAGMVSTGASGTSQREEAENRSAEGGRPWRSLIGLNFLRAAVTLASLAAFQGAAILAGFASSAANPRPGLAVLLFMPLAGLICLAWWALNWFLSLAAVFAVLDGEDTLGALSAAVRLCRERAGAVFAVSTWTGLAHLATFVGATGVVSLPLAFLQVAPGRLVLAGMLLVTLAYFAVADWLYVARLAGYVCIAEMPQELLTPLPAAPLPPAPHRILAEINTTIDRDEPILSDVPNLAVET
ncbi:MAG: hypothetical protein WCA16_08205 [Candidatus Sulfotelmatobacter sp.]